MVGDSCEFSVIVELVMCGLGERGRRDDW
jgi:hypothetical protein